MNTSQRATIRKLISLMLGRYVARRNHSAICDKTMQKTDVYRQNILINNFEIQIFKHSFS